MALISDPERAAARISSWLRDQLRVTGRREFVLGLSGGIDSALALYLAVEAVGAESVLCVLMPYRTSSPDSLAHAEELIAAFGTRRALVDVTAMADAFEAQVKDVTPLRRGNLCARLRMLTLFDFAHAHGLVLGTSNKTETMLGYGTIFGDAAWSLNPLGDLYKTDVRLLARHLGVPDSICEKTPTADLWHGQTDEGELGFSYDEIDRLLVLLVDEKKSRRELLESGVNPKLLDRMVSLIRASSFKRRLAPIAWLGEPYSLAHVEDPSW